MNDQLKLSVFLAVSLLASCGTANYPGDLYGNGNTASSTTKVEARSILPGPLKSVDTSLGKVLGGKPDNLTLYTFAKDEPGVSNCYDACAAAWPPFLVADASKATKSLTIAQRKDGGEQWVLNGQPLYFWAGDRIEGDTKGADIPNWFVVKPPE